MSAIFGYCSFYDLPASVIEDRIRIMKKELTHWAPDGFKTKISDSSGFGIAVQVLRDLDSDLPDPSVYDDRSLLFTASARLDNRKELIASFHENSSSHDVYLLFKSYLKNGETTPQKLMGDWAYAAFHTDNKKLSLARDHIGNTAFYYTCNQSFIAFAPTPGALLALEEVSDELDEWKIACELTRFPHSEWANHTKWREIRQLMPSHQLTARSGNVSIKRYWSFQDIPSVRLNSEEEYYEQFRELISQAVENRVSGYKQVGTMLSSGLDSGAVTAFAARQLAMKNRFLTAYTSVPLYKNVPGMNENKVDEWPVAHTNTRFHPNIKHIAVNANSTPPHHVLKQSISKHGDTFFAPENGFWIEEILHKAKTDGIEVMLTGQLGNGVISWNGDKNQVLYQFIKGRWLEGLKSVKKFKEEYQIRWYSALRYLFMWQLFSPVKHWLKHLANPEQPVWTSSSPINPVFADRLNLKQVIRSSRFVGYRNTLANPRERRIQIMEKSIPFLSAIWHRYGAYHNMDILDPTGDIRLLEFCFGIPDEIHAKRGRQRLLIKQSLQDILPKEVLNNRYNGRQSADLFLRLLNYKKDLKKEIDSISQNASFQKYIDVPSLYNALKRLSPSLTYSEGNQLASRLLNGLMFGYFFEKYR